MCFINISGSVALWWNIGIPELRQEAVNNHGEMCILLKLDDTRYSSFLRNLKVVLRTLQTKIFVRIDLTDMLLGN